ncbi:MAG: hypothetical protein ABF292_05580, partial [Desulfobacterales bacterium]
IYSRFNIGSKIRRALLRDEGLIGQFYDRKEPFELLQLRFTQIGSCASVSEYHDQRDARNNQSGK